VDEEVDEVTAPGALGEFGVLPDHTAFLSLLQIGELTYKQGPVRRRLAISGGYAEVLDNVMTVLTETAEFAEEINIERARVARERAETRLKELDREDKEYSIVEAALLRAVVRLQVASREARR